VIVEGLITYLNRNLIAEHVTLCDTSSKLQKAGIACRVSNQKQVNVFKRKISTLFCIHKSAPFPIINLREVKKLLSLLKFLFPLLFYHFLR